MTNDWMSYRASHDDRTLVEAELRTAFQDGRLGISDFEERLEKLHEALSYRDLSVLVEDLPRGVSLIERIGNPRYRMQVPTAAPEQQPPRRLVSAYPMLSVAAAIVFFPFLMMMLVMAFNFVQGFSPILLLVGSIFILRGRRRYKRRSGWYR